MSLGFPPERHKPGLAWNEAGREITLQKFKKELNLSLTRRRKWSGFSTTS